MTLPTLPRDPEGLSSRTIWLVAAGTVLVALILTLAAWLLVVVPNGSPAAARPSTLRHDLFETASDGAEARARAARALEQTAWVDRGAGFARIPIEQAIDAVVADPTLIGAPR